MRIDFLNKENFIENMKMALGLKNKYDEDGDILKKKNSFKH